MLCFRLRVCVCVCVCVSPGFGQWGVRAAISPADQGVPGATAGLCAAAGAERRLTGCRDGGQGNTMLEYRDMLHQLCVGINCIYIELLKVPKAEKAVERRAMMLSNYAAFAPRPSVDGPHRLCMGSLSNCIVGLSVLSAPLPASNSLEMLNFSGSDGFRQPIRLRYLNIRKYTVPRKSPLYYNPGKHMDASKRPHPLMDGGTMKAAVRGEGRQCLGARARAGMCPGHRGLHLCSCEGCHWIFSEHRASVPCSHVSSKKDSALKQES